MLRSHASLSVAKLSRRAFWRCGCCDDGYIHQVPSAGPNSYFLWCDETRARFFGNARLAIWALDKRFVRFSVVLSCSLFYPVGVGCSGYYYSTLSFLDNTKGPLTPLAYLAPRFGNVVDHYASPGVDEDGQVRRPQELRRHPHACEGPLREEGRRGFAARGHGMRLKPAVQTTATP